MALRNDRSRQPRPWRARALAASLSLVLSGIAAQGFAATAFEARSDDFVKKAQDYIQKKNGNAAIIELKNALQQNPDNLVARRLLGELYLAAGNGPAAEKEFSFVKRAGTTDPRITIALGRAYLLQGKYAEVLDEIPTDFAERATGADAQAAGDAIKAGAFVVRGQAQLALGKYRDAEASFRNADTLDPAEALPRVGIAQGLVARHKLDEAEKEVDVALEREPGSAEANTLKGELRRMKRDLEGAVAHFDRAIEAKPQSMGARLGRAASLVDLNRDAEAQKDIDYVLKRDQHQPLAIYLSAFIKSKRKDYQGALDMLSSAGRALDDHMPSLYLKGVASYALNRREEAARYLERYVDAVPRSSRARRLLSATYMREGDPERAATVLEPLLKAGQKDAQLLSLLATAYVRSGRYTEGMALYEQAAEAAPDAANIRTQLALTRLALGQSESAVGDLEKAIDLAPDARQLNVLLALAKLRAKDYDGALAAAQALGRKAPDNPLADNLEGAARLAKGDIDGAQRAFEAALQKSPDFYPARMNLAQLYLGRNEPDKARAAYERILDRDPSNLRALLAMADLAARQKRGDEVVSWLERAAESHPKAVEPRLRLVDHYARSRNVQKALAEARALNQMAPDNPRVIEKLGRLEVAAGEPVLAVTTFRRLTELVPKSAKAWSMLAGMQLAAQDPRSARESLERAIGLDERYLPAHVALVELEAKEGNVDRAIAQIERMRKIAPGNSVADMLMGDVLMRERKYDQAHEAYSAAMAKSASSSLAARRFEAAQRAGRGKQALAELQAYVDRSRDNQARYRLAGAYIQAGRYQEAIRESEALLKANPDSPILLNNLAWLYHRTGDKRALEFGRRAFEHAQDRPEVMDTYGWIQVQQGQVADGLALLEKAHNLVPTQADIHYHYAAALEAAGRGEDAKRELERLLRSGIGFDRSAEAKRLLGRLSGKAD